MEHLIYFTIIPFRVYVPGCHVTDVMIESILFITYLFKHSYRLLEETCTCCPLRRNTQYHVNIIVQYLKLHNNNDRLVVMLKGCGIYCVNQNPFETYCAVPKTMRLLCVVLRSNHSVCSELPSSRLNNKMAGVANGSYKN